MGHRIPSQDNIRPSLVSPSWPPGTASTFRTKFWPNCKTKAAEGRPVRRRSPSERLGRSRLPGPPGIRIGTGPGTGIHRGRSTGRGAGESAQASSVIVIVRYNDPAAKAHSRIRSVRIVHHFNRNAGNLRAESFSSIRQRQQPRGTRPDRPAGRKMGGRLIAVCNDILKRGGSPP